MPRKKKPIPRHNSLWLVQDGNNAYDVVYFDMEDNTFNSMSSRSCIDISEVGTLIREIDVPEFTGLSGLGGIPNPPVRKFLKRDGEDVYYEELTYMDPYTQDEVYGNDEFGWYGYVNGEMAGEWKDKTPNANPLFVTFNGLTAAKLRRRGYRLFKNEN